MTASTPKFSQMDLRLEKLTGLVYLTDELLQDSTAMARYVANAVAEELSFKVVDAILNGTGAGQPLGIITANSLVEIAAETNQESTTLLAENIIKMYARLWPASKRRAIVIANVDALPQLMTMSIAVGTGGQLVWQPMNQLAGRPRDTILGMPCYYVEQSPSLGTLGDLLLADLSQYIFIERPIQQASSIHVQFLTGQTAIRWVWRCNGQPNIQWESATTPYKGSATVSPFVGVASRE